MNELLRSARLLLSDEREKERQRREKYMAAAAEKCPGCYDAHFEIKSAMIHAMGSVLTDGNALERAETFVRPKRKTMEERLIAAGFEPDAFDEKPFCAVCGDTCVVSERGRAVKYCDCLLKHAAALANPDLPRARLSDFDTGRYKPAMRDAAEQGVRTFIEKFPALPNLLLQGDSGVGKTFIAAIFNYELTRRGKFVMYMPVTKLIKVYERRRFGGGTGDEPELCETCDLLIIDDLGLELINAYTREVLHSVITIRRTANRPTVCATLKTDGELGELYRDAPTVLSRLMDDYKKLKLSQKTKRENGQ